jgi:hypothetical protein
MARSEARSSVPDTDFFEHHANGDEIVGMTRID